MRAAAVRGCTIRRLSVALPQPPEDADERAERGRVEEGDGLEVDDDVDGSGVLDEMPQIVAQGGGGESVDLAAKHDDVYVAHGLDRGHGIHVIRSHNSTGPAWRRPRRPRHRVPDQRGSASSRTMVVFVRVAWKPPQLDQNSIERIEAGGTDDHEDDADDVEVEARDRCRHGPGQDGADCDQDEAYGNTHLIVPFVGEVRHGHTPAPRRINRAVVDCTQAAPAGFWGPPSGYPEPR